jgi:hypothetical protein
MSAVTDALGLSIETIGPSDMAWVPSRGWLCITFSMANDIVCVEPVGNTVAQVIHTGLGKDFQVWGLAYDEVNDRFFVAAGAKNGGFQRRILTIAGIAHPDPGKVLNTCTYTRQGMGLAWNPSSQTLWTLTRGAATPDVAFRQVDPGFCAEISSVAAPQVGVGLDLEPDGDFVQVTLFAGVLTNRSDDRIDQQFPWLSLSASDGNLKKGTQKLTIAVDRATVPDNVSQILLYLRGNGGAQPEVTIPITLQR